MRNKSGSGGDRRPLPGWREYQAQLHKHDAGKHSRRLRLATLLLVLLGLCGLYPLMGSTSAPSAMVPPAPTEPFSPDGGQLSKKEVRELLDKEDFNNLTSATTDLSVDNRLLHVETSLDPGLQKYLLDRLDRKYARAIGIVMMDGSTGQVLAMAGFDSADEAVNPCLRSTFPSASIFKIVTAASAVEHCGLTPETPMHFNGGRYTLYKRQLNNMVNRYTNTLSFKQAFAESVDPVFGKLGEHRLGGPVLEKSADAFGFNESLNFDLPMQPSHFQVNDEPYHWAELASGFNRQTTISPLHGAVMASAVLNGGRMVTPSLIDRIVGGSGKVLYQRQQGWEQQAMSSKAAAVLGRLMEATITSGTARNFFRDYRRDKVLSHLEIGGKTGTIDNQAHDARYDWFVGFAKERDGGRQVVVAVLVAHGKYIGTRSGEYARMAIRYYFGEQASSASVQAGQAGG